MRVLAGPSRMDRPILPVPTLRAVGASTVSADSDGMISRYYETGGPLSSWCHP
jgi:hypothetical protein